jgi:hypothetical protein
MECLRVSFNKAGKRGEENEGFRSFVANGKYIQKLPPNNIIEKVSPEQFGNGFENNELLKRASGCARPYIHPI